MLKLGRISRGQAGETMHLSAQTDSIGVPAIKYHYR